MTPRDTGRARFYEAERMVHRLFEGAGNPRTVQIGGTQLTLPAEARFADVDAVGDYVRRVLALPSVRETFPIAAQPLSVRARRGHRSAVYHRVGSSGSAEIAIPLTEQGRWALRELVVLHEIAHHLDDSGGPAHGSAFAATLTELAGLVLGPETALVYRIVLAESGI